jgi:hypothetical protein
MTGRVRIALVLLLASLIFGTMWPQTRDRAQATTADDQPLPAHPRGYVCYRTAKPPVLDGKLDDDAWQSAPWSEDFGDIEGERRPAPRFRTRVKMLWDDKGLYIGAELEEPHVWATLTRHDSVIFRDNDFEVFLDPDGDSHLYAELELNALNTTWDLLLPRPYKDGGKALDAWEITGLRTAVHVNGSLNNPKDRDRGWSVEIFWPWQGLKELTAGPVPPHDGDRWRINFSRVEWDTEIVEGKYRKIADRPEHNWVWSPQGVIDMHRPERWGYLQFSTSRPGSVTFRPDPTQAARDVLHRIYYAQRAYHEKHKRWARSLDALGLAGLEHPSLLGPPVLETTTSLYEAHVTLRRPDAVPRRWHIRSDARVWGD